MKWREKGKDRKKLRDMIAPKPTPTMGMDPERAGKELRRQRVNLAGLDPKHPQYDKLFRNGVDIVHELEDICGIERTKYVKGMTAAKVETEVPPALQEKLNKYGQLPDAKRKAIVEKLEDAALLTLIRDSEPIAEIQELAVTRLAMAGAL